MSDVLLQLQQDSPLLVAVFDAEDELRHANAAYRQAYALEPEALTCWAEQMRGAHRTGHGQLVQTDDFEVWLAVAQARRRSQPYRAFELDLIDGRRIWMTETLHANGWLLCVGSDLSGLRAPAPVLGSLADEETSVSGLLGPRGARQALQRLLSLNEAWPLSVALLALDADPASGEEGAAARSAEFGRLLQGCVRREDVCGCLDDQGYLLILPNAGPGQARAIVERLLSRLRQALARQAASEPGASCSAGLIQANWGEAAEVTLQRVTQVLQQARAAGGNQLGTDGS